MPTGGPARAFFIAFEKANRHIDRNDFQIWTTIEQVRERADFSNNQPVQVHYYDGPTSGRAVYASDAGHLFVCPYWCNFAEHGPEGREYVINLEKNYCYQ